MIGDSNVLGVSSGLYAWRKYSVDSQSDIQDLIEYIVSDNPNKYPDGGVASDGYYYVRANEGMYIWKKYKYRETIQIEEPRCSITSNRSTVLSLTNANFDLNLINEYGISYIDFFDSFWYDGSAKYGFKIYDGVLYYEDNGTDYEIIGFAIVSSTTATFTATRSVSSSRKVNLVSSAIVLEEGYKNFFDYVVDSDPNKYPDGGMQDGYWWEKVLALEPSMFGCTKMAVDKITPTADLTLTVTAINHSLGEIPRLVILFTGLEFITSYLNYLFTIKAESTNNYGYGGIYNYGLNQSGLFDYSSGASYPWTESTIMSKCSLKLKANVPYTLITMA